MTRFKFAMLAAAVAVLALSWGEGPHLAPVSAASGVARLACLKPRQPQTRPATGWLKSTQQPLGLDSGSARTTTWVTKQAATKFANTIAHGFTVSSVSESGTPGCAQYRFVRLTNPAGDFAILEVAQLIDPIDTHTLPVGENGQFRHPTDGTDLYVSDFDGDGCRRSAINVSTDGLLIRVSVANKNSVNTSGWPTTLYTPSTNPHAPAPLTLNQVAWTARQMLKYALAH